MPTRGRRRSTSARLALVMPLLWVTASPLHGADPLPALELSLPIDCDIGKTCFIQNFVDVIKGPGARDFSCGKATYDGHKGTDFRLVSTADVKAGMAVLAAADGIVKGWRDGVPDVLYTKARDASLAGRDCGNGVFIDHGEGWDTQYCHMRRGSVLVRRGQRVLGGTKLGEVGYSGKAAFAHLHLSVRHNKQVIDPFTGQTPSGDKQPKSAQAKGAAAPGSACKPDVAGATSLWAAKLQSALRYRSGQIIETGFSGTLLGNVSKEAGLRDVPRPTKSSPVLIFSARAIKLHAGDRLQLNVTGPGGFRLQTTTAPTSRAKAAYRAFIGKKRKRELWPSGVYKGQVQLIRNRRVISQAQAGIEIR